jgi:hypothetical protein
MLSEDAEMYRQRKFSPSRIPALDALSAFVPGDDEDAVVDEMISRIGFSRWYPVEGGHEVLILYEGGPFDADRFTVKKGAWDHEHCRGCQANIPPMTLCWMTESGPTVILCETCYRGLFPPDPA